MAEDQEERSREDLSDEASPYKIEELRRKGQVSQSREVSGLLAVLAVAATVYASSNRMGQELAEFMRYVFQADLSSRLDLATPGILGMVFDKALAVMITVGLPVGLAGFVIGALGSYIQIGSVFSADPLTPDLNKVNPINGLKRILSMRQVIEGLRMFGKMLVLAFVSYLVVKHYILISPGFLGSEASSVLGLYGETGRNTFFALAGVLAVFAALDFAHQRWEWGKKIRLTKEEAKKEYKETQGDPQIKARIRAIQREMSRKRMMAAVKTADVVITNPTHIAIAVSYDRDNMAAPKVVAKGADFVAQKIKKIAADAGVPMVENVPLARTLYKTVKLGQAIPRALYQAVAEVLAHVYRLKGRKL